VKPGNLHVSDSSIVKLADFGIARATDQSSITQVGSVLGTAAYLAPEQARGEEAGPRADIYSLGVVTYQLLCGRLPYEAASLQELALKQQRELPVPLDELNPQVPPALAQAVALALAIDQRARPADAMVLAEALRNGAHGFAPVGTAAHTAPLGTGATRLLPGDDPTRQTRVVTPPERGRRQLAPIPPPARRTDVAYDRAPAAPPAAPPRSRGLQRFLIFLLLALLFTLAVAVAILISTSTSGEAVHLRRVAGHDAQSVINSLRDLVNANTR
jgi:serine/threonine-protein kinase